MPGRERRLAIFLLAVTLRRAEDFLATFLLDFFFDVLFFAVFLFAFFFMVVTPSWLDNTHRTMRMDIDPIYNNKIINFRLITTVNLQSIPHAVADVTLNH